MERTQTTENGTTTIKENNIKSSISRWNTSSWNVCYYVNGEFESCYNYRFKTRKECIAHFDHIKELVNNQW
jgi:hypothetical protein